MHILSPETDNCPSWISGRERMTVENISWSISTKECCRPRRGLNPRPPGLLTLYIFHPKLLCLFIISSGLGYQKCWQLSIRNIQSRILSLQQINVSEIWAGQGFCKRKTSEIQSATSAKFLISMCISAVLSGVLGLLSGKILNEIWVDVQENIWLTKFEISTIRTIWSRSLQ